jgi:hypothetical protein
MWQYGRLVRLCSFFGWHTCVWCILIHRVYFKTILGRESTTIIKGKRNGRKMDGRDSPRPNDSRSHIVNAWRHQ